MRDIGQIQFVQIQRASLKINTESPRRYDPQPLQRVDQIAVTADGAYGVLPDGAYVVDIHNATHPHTRHNTDSDNGLSIGFTSHYRLMRDRFGAHLLDGIAGENIMIEADQPMALADLGSRIGIQNPTTGAVIYLNVLGIVAPCTPFSQFCAQQPDLAGQPLKETLQFLQNGMRGFLVSLPDSPSALINTGDRVLVEG